MQFLLLNYKLLIGAKLMMITEINSITFLIIFLKFNYWILNKYFSYESVIWKINFTRVICNLNKTI